MSMQISISNSIGGIAGAQVGGTPTPPPFSNTQSIALDGVDDFVDIGSPASLNLSTITISAWIKTTNNGSIVGSDDQHLGRRFIFQILSSGELRFNYWNTSNAIKNIVSTTTLNDGNWHHVMAINNGTELKLYIDGVLDNSSLDGGNIKLYPSTPIHIGDRSFAASREPFNGSIDEVAIWSSDQSTNASAIGSTIPTDLTPYAPLSWWRCGDGDTAPILSDNGSGGNDGTMTNFSTFSTDVPTASTFSNTKSILLDGVDDYVDVGYIAELNNASAFTYSGWYKQTTLDQERFLMGFFVSAGNWFGLYTWSDGNMYIHFKDGGVNKYGAFDYSTLVTANAWFNIVIVFNGSNSTNADRLKCYINGTQATLSFVGTQPTNTPIGANNLTLGKMDSFTQTWLGGADELALWNTDESANVSIIYNSGVPNDISSLSPLSWWRCGDGDTAPTLTDNGSASNDGTMTNFSTFSTDVPTASTFSNTKSIALDGVDDYVSVPNSTSLNITTAMSVSMWFKTTSSSGMYPLTQGSGSEIKYYVQFYAPINRIRVLIFDGNSVTTTIDNTQVFNDGQWHNLTFTTDALTTTDGVKVYFDSNILSNKGTLNNNGIRTAAAGLFIGQIPNTARFNGNIDEVSLFNSELSQSDITSIYGGGVPSSLSSYSSLVSWWRCGDGDSAPILSDNGSGGNDGTMTNFTTFSTDVPT